jgi:hypothetical protein
MPKAESSTVYRKRRAECLHLCGHPMLTPCSNCVKYHYSCILDLSTGLYSECIGNNTQRTCNLVVPEEKFHQNTEDHSKLEQELEVVEDLEIAARSKARHIHCQLA